VQYLVLEFSFNIVLFYGIQLHTLIGLSHGIAFNVLVPLLRSYMHVSITVTGMHLSLLVITFVNPPLQNARFPVPTATDTVCFCSISILHRQNLLSGRNSLAENYICRNIYVFREECLAKSCLKPFQCLTSLCLLCFTVFRFY
jgi:hypothetical protein